MSADASTVGMHVGLDPIQVIADSPLMRDIDRTSLDGLRAQLESIVLDEESLLPLDGTGGGALYFVASGRLEIVQASTNQDSADDHPRVLATIVPGDVVSEMRSPTGDEGAAAARAVDEARLVKLAKEGFDHYLATHPDVSRKLRSIFSPRFYHNELLRVLQQMFGGLTEELLADIEQRLTWRHIARDDALVRQGEPSSGLFVVVSGRVLEIVESDAGAQVVNESVQGQVVGAMGVFADETETATVVAARDSVLLEFSRESFRELAQRYPKLHEWLARLLSIRLHGVMHEVPSEPLGTNILLIPANDGAPVQEFARRLSEALSQHAACAVVTSAGTEALLNTVGIAQTVEGSPDDLRLRAWLNERETHYRYMIYVADSALTNWTRRCIQQADEVTSIGVSTAASDVTEVEAEMVRMEGQRRSKFQKSLVLLHPAGTARPQGTQRWLQQRGVERHFHIHEGDPVGLDRIVRYVSRRELGLVLSGGGSRGFAHAGIIRALREAGLPVDVVAGVSMGAIVGAAFALSEDFDATVQSLKERLKKAFGDYTLPLVSLARGRRFDHLLQQVFGDANIEDLWMPYFWELYT